MGNAEAFGEDSGDGHNLDLPHRPTGTTSAPLARIASVSSLLATSTPVPAPDRRRASTATIIGVSVSEAWARLRDEIAAFTTEPYLLTVTAGAQPHCGTVTVTWGRRSAGRTPGQRPGHGEHGRSTGQSAVAAPATGWVQPDR